MTLSPDIDARAELQALIDATPYGGTLDLPAGSYFVTRAGSVPLAIWAGRSALAAMKECGEQPKTRWHCQATMSPRTWA